MKPLVHFHLGFRSCGVSLCTLTCQLELSSCWSYLGSPNPWDFMGAFLCHAQQTLYINMHPCFLAFKFFVPFLSQCLLSLKYRGCVIDLTIGVRHPTFWPLISPCNHLHMMENEGSWLMGERYTYLCKYK